MWVVTRPQTALICDSSVLDGNISCIAASLNDDRKLTVWMAECSYCEDLIVDF